MGTGAVCVQRGALPCSTCSTVRGCCASIFVPTVFCRRLRPAYGTERKKMELDIFEGALTMNQVSLLFFLGSISGPILFRRLGDFRALLNI
jgi:hypothetical protein